MSHVAVILIEFVWHVKPIGKIAKSSLLQQQINDSLKLFGQHYRHGKPKFCLLGLCQTAFQI